MISADGDSVSVGKGMPPREGNAARVLLLGCDENIGATVTRFVLRYWISVFVSRCLGAVIFLYLFSKENLWKVPYGRFCPQ